MGTNFYLHPQADCPCCKRPYEQALNRVVELSDKQKPVERKVICRTNA